MVPDDHSPFERPAVSEGYPLSKEEKKDLDRAAERRFQAAADREGTQERAKSDRSPDRVRRQ